MAPGAACTIIMTSAACTGNPAIQACRICSSGSGSTSDRSTAYCRCPPVRVTSSSESSTIMGIGTTDCATATAASGTAFSEATAPSRALPIRETTISAWEGRLDTGNAGSTSNSTQAAESSGCKALFAAGRESRTATRTSGVSVCAVHRLSGPTSSTSTDREGFGSSEIGGPINLDGFSSAAASTASTS